MVAAVWAWLRARRYLAGSLALLVALAGVLAAHLRDGSPLVATVTVGSTPVSLAVDAQTGRAFVVNNADNDVSVLDTRTGRLLRTVAVGIGPTAAVVDERDRAVLVTNALVSVEEQTGQFAYFQYAGDVAGAVRGLSILDAGTGRLRRTVPLNVSIKGVVADIRHGRVLVSTNDFGTLSDGSVGMLAVASGKVARLAVVPQAPLAMVVVGQANRIVVLSAANGGTVSVLDATSGRLVGRHVVGPILLGHTLAVDEAAERAFVLTASLTANRGSVCILDTRTGALLRALALHSLPAGVAVDERTGHAFVTAIGRATRITVLPGYGSLSVPISTGGGAVLMLDARSGAILHSSSVGIAPGALAVDDAHGHVLVATVGAMDSAGNPTGPGSVSVLDARSGAVLRTVPAGITPGDIAVDERAGRALVLNLGGLLDAPDAWAWLLPPLRQRLPFVPRHAPGIRGVGGSVTVLDTARL